jgi:K+-transporting ATPase ATPase B chain
MSGVDLGDGRRIRKGSVEAIEKYVKDFRGTFPAEMKEAAASIAKNGGTPLAVSEDARVAGIIHLKDIVKGGIKERFSQPRQGLMISWRRPRRR